MKKWQIPLMFTLALALIILNPLMALAQSEEPAATEKVRPVPKGALAIIAPGSSLVNQELTVRVFLRENQEPFAGAGVWAITKEAAETLKAELAQLRKDSSQPADEKDYKKVIEGHGIFLGQTEGNGKLACTFEQSGQYILVAAENGYLPGYTHIGIREITKALGIQAPKRVPVGEKLTMTVYERITQEPVEGVTVWAVTRDKAEALREEAKKLKADASIPAGGKDYEALVKSYGFSLGETDQNGKLDYTFDEAGGYLLVAVDQGYIPGFAPLNVHATPKALGIKVNPRQTQVGQEATLNVFDRQSNDPIEGAGIWAISRDKVESLKEEIAALKGDKSNSGEKDYEAAISAYGTPLDRTGADGKFIITFDEPGGYLLVAVMEGYVPGFTTLAVKEIPSPSTQGQTIR